MEMSGTHVLSELLCDLEVQATLLNVKGSQTEQECFS